MGVLWSYQSIGFQFLGFSGFYGLRVLHWAPGFPTPLASFFFLRGRLARVGFQPNLRVWEIAFISSSKNNNRISPGLHFHRRHLHLPVQLGGSFPGFRKDATPGLYIKVWGF